MGKTQHEKKLIQETSHRFFDINHTLWALMIKLMTKVMYTYAVNERLAGSTGG